MQDRLKPSLEWFTAVLLAGAIVLVQFQTGMLSREDISGELWSQWPPYAGFATIARCHGRAADCKDSLWGRGWWPGCSVRRALGVPNDASGAKSVGKL